MTLGDIASAYMYLSNFALGLIDIYRVLKKNKLYVKIDYNFEFFKQVWYLIENDNDLYTLQHQFFSALHVFIHAWTAFSYSLKVRGVPYVQPQT